MLSACQSSQRIGSNLLLHGYKQVLPELVERSTALLNSSHLQLTLDDNVLEIFTHHRGVRVHSFGLQVVQLQNPFVGSQERVVHLH